MKFLRSLFCCVFVLSCVPSLASAEPSVSEWARRRVHEGLVKRLTEQKSKRFSRERPPPRERRVRVLQSTVSNDKSGRAFVPFAIDVRWRPDAEWDENNIVGCVYQKSGDIFVKYGDTYRPASYLLGKDSEPVTGVCEAAPPPRS